jgi:hypothetical protein
LFGCGNTGKPTTGIDPSEYIMLPERALFFGYSTLTDGELYSWLYIQPKAGQPFLIDDFGVYYDDYRNLKLENLQCGLVDEFDNKIWFSFAYKTTKYHPPENMSFKERLENLYSCVVTAPTAGNYQFIVRYDTQEYFYEGPDMIISEKAFTVLP